MKTSSDFQDQGAENESSEMLHPAEMKRQAQELLSDWYLILRHHLHRGPVYFFLLMFSSVLAVAPEDLTAGPTSEHKVSVLTPACLPNYLF